MHQTFLALWLSINICGVWAQTLPHSLQRSAPAAVKQCRPNTWDVLLKVGWAYAFKSPLAMPEARPCPDSEQETQRNVRPRPTPEPKPEPNIDAPGAVVSLNNSLAELPAAEVMRLARLLYVRPRSSWFNKEKLERELLKRKEFGELGLELTRSAPNANLVLEITRKVFTTRFTCSIIEPSSDRVVGSATASSLGGEIEPHLADAIIKQFKAARNAQEKKED
jgi:hypothetical protein